MKNCKGTSYIEEKKEKTKETRKKKKKKEWTKEQRKRKGKKTKWNFLTSEKNKQNI